MKSLFSLACLLVTGVLDLRVTGFQEINPPPAPDQNRIIALTGARLIDGRGGPPIENSVVVLRGAKILAVGDQNSVVIPSQARQVEVKGLALLPGLIDSHFHSRYDVKIPVEYELKNGITSFRDPGHPFHFYDLVKQSPDPMPRVFLCGAHLDGPPPVWPDQAIVIQNAVHARRAVHEHFEEGASAIKIYFRLPLEHIRATCEAAQERGLLVTAHLELVDASEAIQAGVRGIEHVTSFGTELADPADVEMFKSRILADSNARRDLRHWLWSKIDLDSPRVSLLLDLLVAKKIFVSPTLAIFESRAGEKGAAAEEAKGFANMVRFVGLCHKAGAKVVVGSHTWAPFAEPGGAYQREIELLIAAGLTPMEAITAGTLHNAEFFGISDRLGTIEPGKTADLILLDGNPSVDISALRNIRHVMLNGHWIGSSP